MEAYAVVETGGKQYKVGEGNTLTVERLPVEVGETYDLESVLALSDGEKLTVGTPNIEKAKIASTVVEHIRGDKVINFKKKRRKGYSRKIGHRQELTVLKIDSLS